MQYKRFQDIELSALGLGTMRLPVEGDNHSKIDVEKTRRMVDIAIENGINYFDTAWFYHDGNSESVIGQILKDHPRESYYLATKFPGLEFEEKLGGKRLFEEQLAKCQVDYFDFYLFHNVWEGNVEDYLAPDQEIVTYILRQKEAGRIRHLGFSTHGSLETMKRFLDAWGKYMEFGQIQLNWMDWDLENAREKVKLLSSYGLPVWVMEPVRGGRLAQLPEQFMAPLRAMHPDWTAPEWAFRFLHSIPEVTMVLSGMSNEQQMRENIATFNELHPLNEEEKQTLFDVAKAMNLRNTLSCTGCRYCADRCPQELDIPQIVDRYNKKLYTGKLDLSGIREEKLPASCIGCGNCESACPQKIKICQMMEELSKV